MYQVENGADRVSGDLYFLGLYWLVVNKRTNYIIAYCSCSEDASTICTALNS